MHLAPRRLGALELIHWELELTLTPTQARKLRALVLAAFTDAQIARHGDMTVGDPSSFQGDEKDIILLSLTSVPGERSSTATLGIDASRKYGALTSFALVIGWSQSLESSA